jgi:hypothetical protein
MRELEIRVYPYPDVHSASKPGLSENRLRAITTELPKLFELEAASLGLTESFSATTELVPGRLAHQTDSNLLSDGELHFDLQSVVDGGEDWTAHLLLAKSSERGLDTYGVMFDAASQPGPQRQGCAVFMEAIESYFPSDPQSTLLRRDQLFLRTMAHEIGHVLNLCHLDKADSSIMSEGRPSDDDLVAPQLSDGGKAHLTGHRPEAVRPGGGIGYGRCPDGGHPTCKTDETGAAESTARAHKIRLELTAHPGLAYPRTRHVTLVIGEPLHLTATLINDSGRAVHLPRPPTTLQSGLTVYREDETGVAELTPPLLFCGHVPRRRRVRVEPGQTLSLHETLIHRRGELVFPREGRYRIFARLRISGRWVASPAVTVRVAPPLEPRHEASCELAVEPGCGLFLELGGGRHLAAAEDHLRRLLRTNPDFPLNAYVRLVYGRQAVLHGRPPYGAWRASLERLTGDRRLPPFVRAEARALLGIGAAQASRAAAAGSAIPRTRAALQRLPWHSARLIAEQISTIDHSKQEKNP